MLKVFREYLDNFYLSITGIWCLCQKDVREKFLKHMGPSIVEPSIFDEMPIEVDMYELALRLPEAPFKSQVKVNKYIEKQAMLLTIAAYEWTKDQLVTKGMKDIKNWPDIIKLFNYLRDTCAHYNHFNLIDKRFLPLKWKNKTLTSRHDGEKLFSKWMSPADMEFFLRDVSAELEPIMK